MYKSIINKFLLNRIINNKIIIKYSYNTNILPYKQLQHKSVEIDVETLQVDDSSDFGIKLYQTINVLRSNDIKSSLYGFKYHRAEDDKAYLMLWLSNDECKVPPYATHHCGVGAALLDNNNKLLVVKEHSNNKLVGWKLPGGYVNLGEDFSTAAIREVKEETGIISEFKDILTIRHSKDILFGRSDVYLICRLIPKSYDIIIDNEIQDAQWIDINELEKITTHKLLLSTIKLLKSNYNGLVESTIDSVLPGRLPYKLYSPSNIE